MRQLKISQAITNRESPSLKKYLHEVSKIEMISIEQEVLLAQKIKQGDEAALQRLVKANLRFAISVAKKYQSQGLGLEDLINEGNVGLITAAKRFDETKGFKFISYAVWWIRQSILQAIADQKRMIRLPLNVVGSDIKIGRAWEKLQQQFEREPTPEEIAEIIDMDIEKIYDSVEHSRREISLDAPLASKDQTETDTLLDLISSHEPPTDQILMDESLRAEIEKILSTLKEKERFIITNFFGLEGNMPLTLDAIAEKTDLTRERVRQIKDKVLYELGNKPKHQRLRSYI